ncbi:MAG: hypothetical protein KKC66_05205, partial [Candidatus Omnitrophica bacterium]|nr:hypothetical protein [Candidatus Omnitrophota bacterium]MBU1933277.1 hypothetical protein [Candidatus Omnitrophota bacterium]
HLRRLYFSLGLIHFLLFFVSLIFFIKGNSRYKGFFLIWILAPFFLFSLAFTIKHQRFLMPVLPALAIVTAWGLSRIRNVKLKISLLIAVLFYSLAQFYLLYDISKNRISLDKDHIFFGHTNYRINSVFIHPDKEISDIADVMYKNRDTRDVVKVGFINCTGGRPEVYELLFWSRIINKSIDPYDFIETGDLFLEKFKDLDFIVLALPSDSSISFSDVRLSELRDFFERFHGRRIRDFKKNNPELLNGLLEALEETNELFSVREKVAGHDKVYYIYGREGV